jgi:hypothetical protein
VSHLIISVALATAFDWSALSCSDVAQYLQSVIHDLFVRLFQQQSNQTVFFWLGFEDERLCKKTRLCDSLCQKPRLRYFAMSMQIAMCVCALVGMNHVMAMQPNPKKAVLSDLYHRKAGQKYPTPTSSELVCTSRHERDDPHPSEEGGSRTNLYKIESDLPGKGIWKRYDGSRKPWTHAKISNRADAFGIVKLVKDGKAPKDGMMMHSFAKIAYLSNTERNKQKSILNTAISKIGKECWKINVCSHDVYVSTPVGEDNDNVFSPGLNQLWVILDSGRNEILANVVIASKADDSAIAYFAGCPRNGNVGFNSVMSFLFNEFSSPINPLDYLVVASTSNGFSTVTLDVSHVGNDTNYTIVRWTCATDTISGWKDRGPSGSRGNILFWWSSLQTYNEFQYFMTKGVQIYDICHCYHTNTNQLTICLISAEIGEAKTFEDKIAEDIIGGTHDEMKNASWVWLTRPRGRKSNNSWATCEAVFNR